MKTLLLIFLTALCLQTESSASPYLVEWTADSGLLPEQDGWTRVWGNWEGPYHGNGANRTLHDGMLTYDSLYDEGVFDINRFDRQGQLDPGPGEILIVEWSLRVRQVTFREDPVVAVFSDEGWGVGFDFGVDYLSSGFEGYEVPFSPSVFHDYRLTSSDMRTYALYIDGVPVHVGSFFHAFSQSWVDWGDGTQGSASVHDWTRLRFAVVPEPSGSACICVAVIACCVGRRARC